MLTLWQMSKNMQGKVIKYFRSDENTFLKKVKKHGEDVKNFVPTAVLALRKIKSLISGEILKIFCAKMQKTCEN